MLPDRASSRTPVGTGLGMSAVRHESGVPVRRGELRRLALGKSRWDDQHFAVLKNEEGSECRSNQKDGLWTRAHHRGMQKPRRFPSSYTSRVMSACCATWPWIRGESGPIERPSRAGTDPNI